jgi:fused signal recognition particle receptor
LEETLIAADVGVATTEKLIARVQQQVKDHGVKDPEEAREVLKQELTAILRSPEQRGQLWGEDAQAASVPKPAVILIVGVNGTGKTTSIGKLAWAFEQDGKKVILAAGDTFRAAAIDQLKAWGERVGTAVIAHQQGADPSAVAFDAISAAQSRDADVVIIDTAGRLHTKSNLMEEMRKIYRVIQRKDATAPHEVLLVLDATTGQNALTQAQYFTEAVNVTGILLAKLDGTARGGAVFAICDQLGIPVKFVGTGEGPDDLSPFWPEDFVEALLGSSALA